MPATRRQFLATVAASTALAACDPRIRTWSGAQPGSSPAAALDGMAEAILAEYPESATSLGLDDGRRAALKAQLTDWSATGKQARAEAARRRLAVLDGMTDAPGRLDVAVTRAAHELAVAGYALPYGDVAVLDPNNNYRNSPYVVAQNVGAFVDVPDLLDSKHEVERAADADAWLLRVQSYAGSLEAETERMRHDAGLGVTMPSFLLDKAIAQQSGALARPDGQWTVVSSLAAKARAARLDGRYEARAAALVRERVRPALAAQLAELQRQRAGARDDAGVWALPGGDEWYAWGLRAATTTTLSPKEIHQRGLDELAELHARMDPILRAQGMTRGTVGARMAALTADGRFLYPNTDAGRAELLSYINGRVADVRARLPRAFGTPVKGNLVVKRVPPEIEAGAPGGYAAAGAVDGSTPGNYYINLRDTANWPRWSLPTLSYHEGIPGHIWQGEYTYRLPLIRTLVAFNAYSEGWALYAEQLADELGVYDDDPFGRLGYLQSLAFRAARLVVDTGLHDLRWSRAKAIQVFAEADGSTEDDLAGEVDRYCAWPGQACGYKIGHSEIVRLRAAAQTALGDRYDLKRFDDAVVETGAVPITLLDQVVRERVIGAG